MKRSSMCIVPAALLAVLAACDGSPSAPRPAQLQAVAGSGQTGLTEAPLSAQLVARVTDSRGRGVADVPVSWTVDAGGGTLSAASTQTDAAGDARVTWTMGAAAGSFNARATAAGLPTAVFSATATLPQPAILEIVGGNGQAAAPRGMVADSLAVRVVSAEGRVVPGVRVAWRVTGGDGGLSASASTTSALGIAKVQWALGVPGPNTAEATVPGLAPAEFSAYAVPVASVVISPAQPVVVRGSTLQLVAQPVDSIGNPLAGRYVRWESSAPNVVDVDFDGLVSGLGRGTATITATSEGRSGTVDVTVAQRPPRVTELAFLPDPVDVSTADARLDVLVSAFADQEMKSVYVMVQSTRGDPAGGQSHPCTTLGPISGSIEFGTWQCTLTLPRGSAAGTWTINVLSLADNAGVVTNYTGAELAALGMDVTFQVQSTNEDVTAPTLTAMAAPTVVTIFDGRKRVDFAFSAADGGTGIRLGSASLTRPGAGGEGCSDDPEEGFGKPTGTFRCSVVFPAEAAPVTWNIDVHLIDSVGNLRSYTPAQLQAAGYPHQVTINP